ncbi:beta-ketoacyl-[acyl-carrier-protein] synthase family protein [Aerococcus sanguinicola]|uniref:Beta-ketoacyl-[acyl-carrier-protein] synthase II n=1 Tax=Aerococcus sanguinicola TaxID=119206 RepID=A0A0X8F9P3_9LACT|nr:MULTISPECIES: beta-ketoacyl-ACP synthase II [Aerococcus]AMB93361.1 hypothetical protein AWM72_00550 [Aerococcus sanguinicola]MDK7049740.1 beta-ketoacyl-ACP synthase II [Aerococcus sanguinicola]OFT92156.1 hypothetical protein HMPREF3090_09290 [Aerococcus sp. HMSC23C02]PKZ23032.1 beta-ketoacyl-[acyl-carrier-protein] synthase II [Aerococcus sanguinicola]
MTQGVVVTGMAAISPLGESVEENWQRVRAGQHGLKTLEAAGMTCPDLGVKVCGPLPDPSLYASASGEEAYAILARAAAKSCYQMSGLEAGDFDPYRAGCYLGNGLGCLTAIEAALKGQSKSQIFLQNLAGQTAMKLAQDLSFRGPAQAIATAFASSNSALGEAFRAIKSGHLDLAMAGGSEACLNPAGLTFFDNLTALSHRSDPDRASIPFDRDRDGFVMGEGAAFLLLESLESAQARQAPIYGEIVGYGATSDAHHLTAPAPHAQGLGQAMAQALAEAQIDPTAIDYINAHGTSTPANDASETEAIKQVFGDHAQELAVSSTKSFTGHLLGAAGAIEAIFTLCALSDQFLPPTLGLENPDQGLDLDYVPKQGRPANLRYALSNSAGFGGHNAVLCFKRNRS